MKKILILVASILVSGCNVDGRDGGGFKILSKESIHGRSEAAKFIVECADAANPMSDEEGEDLVAQCERTAHSIFSSRIYYARKDLVTYCERNSVHEVRACMDGVGL